MLAIIKTIKKNPHIEHKSHAIKYKNSPVDHIVSCVFLYLDLCFFVLLSLDSCWAVCLFLFAFNYNKFS